MHLEGSLEPATVMALAARHGVLLTAPEVNARYAPGDFTQFIEAFKWVTSFLRSPADYALACEKLAETLLAQKVVYAEITLSVGVMLLRKQDPLANYAAIRAATQPFEERGLRVQWIFDAVRQFGVPAAMQVAKLAAACARDGVVAFGIGGDELALPARDFAAVYDFVRGAGLQPLIHAGEIGDAHAVCDAIQYLDVVRIGHGIAAMHDRALMKDLADRRIPLEICLSSNVRTGALACQLGRTEVSITDHPLRQLFEHGVPIVLGSDDPAMFGTSINGEYQVAASLGMNEPELRKLVRASFEYAFLEESAKKKYTSQP